MFSYYFSFFISITVYSVIVPVLNLIAQSLIPVLTINVVLFLFSNPLKLSLAPRRTPNCPNGNN